MSMIEHGVFGPKRGIACQNWSQKSGRNWQFSNQNHIVKHTGRDLSYQQIRSSDTSRVSK